MVKAKNYEKHHQTPICWCHCHDNKKFWQNYIVVKKIRESSIMLPRCPKQIYFETNTYVVHKNSIWGQHVLYIRRLIFFNGGFYVKMWCPKLQHFVFFISWPKSIRFFKCLCHNIRNSRLIPKTCISMPIALCTPRACYVHSVHGMCTVV